MANSKREIYQVKSIAGGMSKSLYDAPSNTYIAGVGIDPDLPAASSGLPSRTAGAIIPSQYTKFSGTEIDGIPYWIITQPRSSNSYVYTSAGKIHSFTNVIAMRATDEAGTAFPIAITNGAGNGAAYYNNFIYFAEGTNGDISQYGGLDQGASIALTENVWTGAKFGKTALTNSTYPIMTALSLSIPNHPMHVHGDNALYIGDVLPQAVGSLGGRGCLHRLKTKRTTFDGDTDDGSAYNVFDLPYGYWPADIESYGTDLVIAAFQCKDEKINQGRAELFFWDCISDSFYNRVVLPDPLVTALYNKNGTLYVFSGNSQAGSRVSIYSGGRSVETVAFNEEGISPFAGAVDAFGERMSFGTSIAHPISAGVVVSVGSKFAAAQNTNAGSAVHMTAMASAPNTTPTVTAIKYVQQANNSSPKVIIGWTDNTVKGLDKQGAPAAMANVWQSPLFSIGQKFRITKIIIPLLESVGANTVISPKLYVDTGSTSYSLDAISATRSSGKRYAIYKEPEIGDGTNPMNPAFTDFFLELTWSGSSATPVGLPITFEVEVYDDQS